MDSIARIKSLKNIQGVLATILYTLISVNLMPLQLKAKKYRLKNGK